MLFDGIIRTNILLQFQQGQIFFSIDRRLKYTPFRYDASSDQFSGSDIKSWIPTLDVYLRKIFLEIIIF